MRRPKQTAVALTIVALGAAACGSSGSAARSDPRHIIEAAYTTTLDAKSAKVAISESLKSSSTSGSNESATVTGTGVIDFTNQGFDLTVNSPSGGTEEVLESGDIEYIQVPPSERSQVPGNLPWVSINLDQVDEAKVGKSFAQLSSINSDSPTQALANLSAVSDNVVSLGAATIDGTPTTQYKATVDLTKVADQTGSKAGAKAAQLITQEAKDLGTSTLPVELWVDGTGLVRQLSEQVPIPASSTGATDGSGSVNITLTFSDFGTPAPLTPPPASQVSDITAQTIQQATAGQTTPTTG